MRKQKIEYVRMVQKANEIHAKKPNIELMTIRELTLICKPLKIKSDAKMPIKKQDFTEAYMIWKNRPPQVFEEDICSSDDDNDIIAPITVTNNNIEINDRDGKNNEPVIEVAEI